LILEGLSYRFEIKSNSLVKAQLRNLFWFSNSNRHCLSPWNS